jgi:putative tricarboxylic transport membrane protein
MLETLASLETGFAVATTPENLMYCFIGVFLGTLIGVLPGLGPVAAMALLLPVTFHIDTIGAIIMFAGIYYGAMYGGSTTAILVNIPGEASSVVTCRDGHEMARQGRAGPALGMCAIASFIAGTFAIIGLSFVALPMANIALRFGYPEYFSLMCAGVLLVVYLGSSSVIKAMLMALFGLLLSTVGIDLFAGQPRFWFGEPELLDGLDLTPIIMGLFGVSEVLRNIAHEPERHIVSTKLRHLLPTRDDWRRAWKPTLRGSGLGFFLGVLPGGGAIVSSFAAYSIEKKIADQPERFGKGAIEGVAAPEAANNAATGGAFVPLLTLGIPSNVVMAIIMGALLLHGITPGPLLVREHPDLFWGVIASMYVGNIMLLVLNLPLIGMWVQVLRIPSRVLFPLILLFCTVGTYSVSNSLFDVNVMLVFGVLGYLMGQYDFDGAPLILCFVIGPIIEESLRQSLLLSDGSFSIFVTRPISAAALGLCVLVLATSALPVLRKLRDQVGAATEEET